VAKAGTLRVVALVAVLAGATTLLLTWQGVIADRGTGLALAVTLFVISSVLTVRAALASSLPARPSMREGLQRSTTALRAYTEQMEREPRLRQQGRRGTAVVRGAVDTAQMVNLMPVIDLALDVTLDGAPPRPVRLRQTVPHVALASAQPGASVVVYVDRNDPDDLIVAWDEPAAPAGQGV
jgi:hypothetical protein